MDPGKAYPGKAIKEMKNNKAPRKDGINTKIIKAGKEEIAYNMSKCLLILNSLRINRHLEKF